MRKRCWLNFWRRFRMFFGYGKAVNDKKLPGRVGCETFFVLQQITSVTPAAFPNYWVFFETRAISSFNLESNSFSMGDRFDFL
jgi:hypothetical protein